MNKSATPIIFGEVLFDCFPDGSQILGGAPFNVAWNLQALGKAPKFISRIGKDAQGDKISRAMQDWGMSTDYLQKDAEHSTGRVDVDIIQGEPHYNIVENCAYDFIEFDKQTNFESHDILYHGTLALRNPTSRHTLETLVENHQVNIFLDVNLRQPWWDKAEVQDWLRKASFVKLNEAELIALSTTSDQNIEALTRRFQADYTLDLLIVTQGEKGAAVLDKNGVFLQSRPPAAEKFIDAVGAGDGFTALFIHHLIQQYSLQRCLEDSLAFASRIVGLRGATTTDKTFYQDYIQAID